MAFRPPWLTGRRLSSDRGVAISTALLPFKFAAASGSGETGNGYPVCGSLVVLLPLASGAGAQRFSWVERCARSDIRKMWLILKVGGVQGHLDTAPDLLMGQSPR